MQNYITNTLKIDNRKNANKIWKWIKKQSINSKQQPIELDLETPTVEYQHYATSIVFHSLKKPQTQLINDIATNFPNVKFKQIFRSDIPKINQKLPQDKMIN